MAKRREAAGAANEDSAATLGFFVTSPGYRRIAFVRAADPEEAKRKIADAWPWPDQPYDPVVAIPIDDVQVFEIV